MTFRIVLALILLAAMTQYLPGQTKWWEEERNAAAALEERIIDDSFKSRINWGDGYLEVTSGATCNAEKAQNKAHCYSMSLKTARHLAMEKMAEIIYGVRIDSDNLFVNEVEHDVTLNTSTQGLIKNAREVALEQTEFDDGSIWVEVTMGLTLAGEKGLSSVVVPWMERKTQTVPPRVFSVNSVQAPVPGDASGLIVDGTGLGLRPALAPRILVEGRDEELYGRVNIDRAAAIRFGIVGYTDSVEKARTLVERIGQNPMVVKAIDAYGEQSSDVLLTVGDAARIMATDMKNEFLKECRVVFVVG